MDDLSNFRYGCSRRLTGRVLPVTEGGRDRLPESEELSLPTITIPRADLTSEEVTGVLRAGLGPHYRVVPGMRMPQACLFAAQPNQDPDTILVSIGSSRLSKRFFRAQVTLTRPSGQTVIRIRPGGTSSEFPINALGIARKIRQVLASAWLREFPAEPAGA
jgi:hypothetical protein